MSSRGEVNLERTHTFLWSKKKWTGIPIMSANMDTVGTPAMHRVLSKYNLITCPAKHHLKKNLDKFKRGKSNVCWFGGIDDISKLSKTSSGFIGLDVANGYTIKFVDAVKKLRDKCPKATIAAGNVVTADMTQELILAGADIVKVGIGPGSICTTRVVAGVGYPQFSAILEVSKSLSKKGVPLIADGGVRYTGDIVKAIGAGAQSVMLGSMIAGTIESPGETIIFEGRKFKSYRGMGSLEAMNKGSKDRYFQDVENDIKKLVPEGIVGRVPYKGDLVESIHQFVGGLRAGMGYCGANDIDTLQKISKFVKITTSGIVESHPHGVNITKEAPNYSR